MDFTYASGDQLVFLGYNKQTATLTHGVGANWIIHDGVHADETIHLAKTVDSLLTGEDYVFHDVFAP